MELKAGDRTSSMTVHSVVVGESSRIDSVIPVEDFTVLQNFWKRWKMEYLTGLREIHSREKRAKDTSPEFKWVMVSSIIQSNLEHYGELARWRNFYRSRMD